MDAEKNQREAHEVDVRIPASVIRLRAAAISYFNGREKPFTQGEVADILQVSRFTILRARRDGKLRAFVCGRTVRYSVEDVFRFLMSQTA